MPDCDRELGHGPRGRQWVYNRQLVRALLLSDIHSNLEAFEACLAAAPEYDLVVNLGDVVGYGASPNEVIDRARGLGKYFVRGNHDKAASGMHNLAEFNPVAGFAALSDPGTSSHPPTWSGCGRCRKGPSRLKGFPMPSLCTARPWMRTTTW